MIRQSLLVAFACLGLSSVTSAAKVTVYLLDQNGNTLRHGDAIVTIDLVQNNSLLYAGYYRNRGYYAEEFPNTPIIDVTIYYDLETKKKYYSGLSGRQNHVLFIRTDHDAVPVCVSANESGIMASDYELLEDLDRIYPQGTPQRMSNIRTYLGRTLLKRVDELPTYQDSQIQRERQEFRQRIMKHLR